MAEISKNPYKKDENDPRWRAVEVRREYEKKGYVIENGKVYNPKTGQSISEEDRRRH